MTTQAGEGDAGAGGDQNGGGTGDGGGKVFLDTLPDDIKTHGTMAKFKDVGDLARSYVNLEKMAGRVSGVPADRLIIKPADEKDVEGIKAFNKSMGIPDSPDDYKFEGFKQPDNWNKDEVANARKMLHGAGVSDASATKILSYFTDYEKRAGEATVAQQQAQIAEIKKTTKAEMQKEWGNAYDQKLGDAVMAMEKFFGEEVADMLQDKGVMYDPKILKVLAERASMFKESTSHGSDRNPGGTGLAPTEAQASINRFRGEHRKALNDRTHPEHASRLAELDKLYEQAYPGGQGTRV